MFATWDPRDKRGGIIQRSAAACNLHSTRNGKPITNRPARFATASLSPFNSAAAIGFNYVMIPLPPSLPVGIALILNRATACASRRNRTRRSSPFVDEFLSAIPLPLPPSLMHLFYTSCCTWKVEDRFYGAMCICLHERCTFNWTLDAL